MTNQSTHTQEPEQNWIPLTYNKNISQSANESLYCKNEKNILKLDYTEEEFVKRLVEGVNTIPNSNNQAAAIVKPEKIEIVE